MAAGWEPGFCCSLPRGSSNLSWALQPCSSPQAAGNRPDPWPLQSTQRKQWDSEAASWKAHGWRPPKSPLATRCLSAGDYAAGRTVSGLPVRRLCPPRSGKNKSSASSLDVIAGSSPAGRAQSGKAEHMQGWSYGISSGVGLGQERGESGSGKVSGHHPAAGCRRPNCHLQGPCSLVRCLLIKLLPRSNPAAGLGRGAAEVGRERDLLSSVPTAPSILPPAAWLGPQDWVLVSPCINSTGSRRILAHFTCLLLA